MKIRIIAVHSGAAPPEVQQAWVGLVLPLRAGDRGPITLTGRFTPQVGSCVFSL